MKKKVLIIILIGILTLGITGCEFGSKENNYSLGEQVKTELIKFKLLEGKYSYALSNTLNETYGAPKEYDEKTDKDSPFLASKGHTLVAVSFSVENLDSKSAARFFNMSLTSLMICSFFSKNLR